MRSSLDPTTVWSLFDPLSDGVLMAERGGTLRYANRAALACLGLAACPASLEALFQALAPATAWQPLAHPPAELTLSLAQGQLHLRANVVEVAGTAWVQIVVRPALPAESGQPAAGATAHALRQALERERALTQSLLRITMALPDSPDPEYVLRRALEQVGTSTGAEGGSILALDGLGDRLMVRATFGTTGRRQGQGQLSPLALEAGLPGWVVRRRQAAWVADAGNDERCRGEPPDDQQGARLAVPLIAADEVIGLCILEHSQPGAFSQEQFALVEAAAAPLASTLFHAEWYQLVRDQAARLGMLLRDEQVEAVKTQAILESIADGVLVADTMGNITVANVATSLILGIPRRELLGRPVSQLPGVYGASAGNWKGAIAGWAAQPHQLGQGVVLEDTLYFEDKVVVVHLSPVVADGQFYGTVSIFRDISKLVEVERIKSDFVSTVSHELRTPMTSIKGYADLMLMGAAGTLSNGQLRYLQVIKTNADRMSLLVDDLLDISRLESGRMELELRPVDLEPVVRQVVEVHLAGRIKQSEKEITAGIDLDPALPPVQGDGQRIRQLLTNLVDNAFNYTPSGGQVTVRARRQAGFAQVSVIDSGIGIAAEELDKVFHRFYRVDDARVQQVPGTGLGLSIAHSLVQMLGGNLTVQSRPGQGSTFTFTLPLASPGD